MLRKLFGETDEEQFAYLKPRITALGVAAVCVLIGALLTVVGIGIGQTVVVYDEKTGKLLYKGNKVFKFYDRITDDISCFYLDENGTVMVEVMRNKKGILTGIKAEMVK